MENQNDLTPSKPLEIGSANNLRKILGSYPLIRDLKNPVPIEQALGYCFVLTGLKSDRYPTPIEKGVLVEFVRKYYPGLVAEEIKRAFDMACRGVFPDCETNHYQNFTCAYFGSIMSAYIDHRADELAQSKPLKEWSQEEFDTLKDWNDRLFVPFETNELKHSPLDYLWYDRLYEIGIYCISKDEVKGYLDKAVEITPKKKRKHPHDAEETKDQYVERVKKTMKCLAFESWIQEQQFAETDIRKLIMEKLNP